MSTLLAGPWIGEFGVELFLWQGHIRTLAESYKQTIVAGRPAHAFLYEDFTHKYQPYKTPVAPCSGYRNMTGKLMVGVHNVFSGMSGVRIRGIDGTPDVVPSYVMYGHQAEADHYDMVFAARNIQFLPTDKATPEERERKTERNWPLEYWVELRRAFPDLRICSVGTKDAALHVPDTEDKRDIPMHRLADILASSSCVIGPSTGIQHFASLCGCPQVVWFGNRDGGDMLVDRYYYDWNPFRTQVVLATRYEWQPPAEFVIDAVAHARDLFLRVPERPKQQKVRHSGQVSLQRIYDMMQSREALPQRNLPIPLYPATRMAPSLSL